MGNSIEKGQVERNELKGDPYSSVIHLINMHADRLKSS